jgi:protein-S-isoprenylcysteine O-methyltransferase Ste14
LPVSAMLSLLSINPSPLVWAYLVLVALFFLISIAYRGVRRDVSIIRGPRMDFFLFILVNLTFMVLPFAHSLTSIFYDLDYSLPDLIGILGIVGLMTAVLIRAKAHRDLGKSFTIAPGTRKERDLVTSGIYARVRHPMYLSMLVWGFSAPLVLQNYLVGLAPLASIGAFLLVRLPLEERILLEEFGERYRLYMARTGRLFPRLFR